uniref:Designed myoglobin n=1 Tax=synthetic construct TaxID=32630 RepID=UPI002D21EF05|nr:Chain A, Designed myoglobin [synthetic construct]8U5A_B Chain B, Designed myoglobin [synthetic construct]
MSGSEEKAALVLALFDRVEADREEIGAAVLRRTFEEHPETLKKFPRFLELYKKGSPELDALLKEHGKTVLDALIEIARLRYSGEDYRSLIKELAKSHKEEHKIPIEDLRHIAEALLAVLAERFPDEFGPEARAALTDFLDWFIAEIEEEYKKGGGSGSHHWGSTHHHHHH